MRHQPGLAHPRTVLLAALLFIVLALGLYFVAPWVLPVRIVEGPLLQQAGPDAVTLIWYTTRPMKPGECAVTVQTATEEFTLGAEADGRRNRVRIDQLATGRAYPYRVHVGHRTLAEATLHTNKPADQPYSFLVFGDSGKGTQVQYLLAGQMRTAQIAPDFILHLGDLVYDQGDRRHFNDRFFAPYRHLLAEINFWPALGNHDIGNYKLPETEQPGQAYFEVFELPANGPPGLPPGRNYWFDYASARVAVIDSNKEHDEAALAEHVVPWLEQVFTDCDATWKFAALHHPPYTAGAYPEEPRLQRTVVPAFEALGVDVVFCAHDHMYQRTHPIRGGQVAQIGPISEGRHMPSMLERIHGVEAAAAIANSMGDITEGMTYEEIDAKYGLLQELLPQERTDRVRKQAWGPDFHYKAHHRPPGMAKMVK